MSLLTIQYSYTIFFECIWQLSMKSEPPLYVFSVVTDLGIRQFIRNRCYWQLACTGNLFCTYGDSMGSDGFSQ